MIIQIIWRARRTVMRMLPVTLETPTRFRGNVPQSHPNGDVFGSEHKTTDF